jgi:hypothetical protein
MCAVADMMSWMAPEASPINFSSSARRWISGRDRNLTPLTALSRQPSNDYMLVGKHGE